MKALTKNQEALFLEIKQRRGVPIEKLSMYDGRVLNSLFGRGLLCFYRPCACVSPCGCRGQKLVVKEGSQP